MLLHLVSPEGSLAAEASGRGGAVQGRPVLIKLLLEGQYLHEMMKPDHQPTGLFRKFSTELIITQEGLTKAKFFS